MKRHFIHVLAAVAFLGSAASAFALPHQNVAGRLHRQTQQTTSQISPAPLAQPETPALHQPWADYGWPNDGH